MIFALGNGCQNRGELKEAAKLYSECYELERQAGADYLAFTTLTLLGIVQGW